LVPNNFLEQGQFSVNGQRPDANYFTVDGVSANLGTPVSSFGQGGTGQLPAINAFGGFSNLVSLDALQEFRIQTSTFAPEFGRTPGAQVSVVTKSGTNAFHGTAFEYLRNDMLDANDWFADNKDLKKPALRQNNFGGVLGGPIIKDKLFFFMDGELTRQHSVAPAPIPASDPLSAFSGAYNSPFKETDLLGKLDYNLGHNARLFARFSYFQNLAFSTFGAPTLQPFKDKNYTRSTVVGTDFTTGSFTHSIRFEYLKFQNLRIWRNVGVAGLFGMH